MLILNFYYNENNKQLYIEFTEKKQINQTYRTIELGYKDIEYYSPTIINERDLYDIDDEFIIELLDEYFKHNDFPQEEFL